MDSPEVRPDDKRVEDERRAAHERDAPRKARAATRFVDPYDMRAEPQQEEPGYGHGV